MQLVDQPLFQQQMGHGGAAVNQNVPRMALLELGDTIGLQIGEDMGVLPTSLGHSPADYVLGELIDALRKWFLGRWPVPRKGRIRRAAQQYRIRLGQFIEFEFVAFWTA